MKQPTKEEKNIIHNKQVAKEGSWIHALFEEAGFTLKNKQEIWKRLAKDKILKDSK